MEVNVLKLKDNVTELRKKIEEYEECNANINNILKQSSSFWNDGKSDDFFKHLENKKIDNSIIIDDLKKINKINNYLVDEYEKIGQKIIFDLTKKDDIKNSFDKNIENLSEIIGLFNTLDLNYSNNKNEILNYKKEIETITNTMKEIKEKTLLSFDKIEEIENSVNNKVSKTNISIVKEINVNDYL